MKVRRKGSWLSRRACWKLQASAHLAFPRLATETLLQCRCESEGEGKPAGCLGWNVESCWLPAWPARMVLLICA